MTAGIKNKLTGTRILMFVSMLLLTAFLGQWLYTQYQDEKQVLVKDLTQQFIYAQDDAFDSNILKTFVIPAVGRSDPNLHYDVLIKNISDSVAKQEVQKLADNMKLRTGLDSAIQKNMRVMSQTKQLSLRNRNVKANIITITSSDSPSEDMPEAELATKAIKVLINNLGDKSKPTLNISDSTVKRNFDKRLAKLEYRFKTSIGGKEGSVQNLIIRNDLPENHTAVSVAGYNPYLFKKIAPEALFAVLLLSITATAFYSMYRSMKSQQRLNAMKNDLVSNMTHELKTPIATVKVALEALDNFQMINDPKTTKDYLHMAVSEMERLELLVNQALNTSLLESGSIRLHFEKCNLRQLAQQVIAAMSLRAQQVGATLKFETDGENFNTNIDKLHLQGVLINLIDNSLKYGGNSPQITVRLKENTDSITISVTDDGPGISPKYLNRVFDKFFRVPTGNVHNTRGYGLGLSYAKQVIDQHGGTIDVTNNEVAGCTFSINLKKA